jgi:hypothetical protein
MKPRIKVKIIGYYDGIALWAAKRGSVYVPLSFLYSIHITSKTSDKPL